MFLKLEGRVQLMISAVSERVIACERERGTNLIKGNQGRPSSHLGRLGARVYATPGAGVELGLLHLGGLKSGRGTAGGRVGPDLNLGGRRRTGQPRRAGSQRHDGR